MSAYPAQMAPSAPSAPLENRVKRRRNRIPVSCESCHRRKLKCNRQRPCNNCDVRGGGPCIYATKSNGGRPIVTPVPQTTEVQQRLDRLEKMILSAAPTGSGPPPNEAGQSTRLGADLSTISYQSPAATSVSTDVSTNLEPGPGISSADTKWDSMLNEISELKSYWLEGHDNVPGFESENGFHSPRPPFRGLRVLTGHEQTATKAEIMDSLPLKTTSDELVDRFFENFIPFVPVTYLLHRPSWMRQYGRHCQDPSKTSLSFLSQLFSVMSLALRFSDEGGMSSEYMAKSHEMVKSFSQRAAQCLQLYDVTTPGEDIIEAFSLFAHVEHSSITESHTHVWLLVGDVTRLAMRMGYHRDPALDPRFSAFEIERRRRTWYFVSQTDLLFSFQFGLPAVTRLGDFDTQRPRNFAEDDLREDMSPLQQPRPDDEPTDYTYMISGNGILLVFREIAEHLNSLRPLPYDRVLELNDKMVNAYLAIPPHLRRSLATEGEYQPCRTLLQRIQSDLFYHKVMCVLHRRFMIEGLKQEAYAYSVKACITSSMELLACQRALHQNDRWRHIKWYNFTLTNHDFMLAGTILCLYLLSDTQGLGTADFNQRAQIEDALRMSYNIWAEVRHTSLDAEKAFRFLDSILGRLHYLENRHVESDGPLDANAVGQAPAALTTLPAEQDSYSTKQPDIFLGNTSLNVLNDIDWAALDSYFLHHENVGEVILPS